MCGCITTVNEENQIRGWSHLLSVVNEIDGWRTVCGRNPKGVTTPLYLYKCEDCAREFEVFTHRVTEKPPEEGCCWCGRDNLTRVPAAPAVRFKGAGFPGNDARKKA